MDVSYELIAADEDASTIDDGQWKPIFSNPVEGVNPPAIAYRFKPDGKLFFLTQSQRKMSFLKASSNLFLCDFNTGACKSCVQKKSRR